MADDKVSPPPAAEPAVTRWLAEQKEWQRTLLTYFDSMVKNDDFLVHLGNAMRGSLLAGKPYPTAVGASAAAPDNAADDRLDQVLFALHKIQGEIADLKMSIATLQAPQAVGVPKQPSAAPKKKNRKTKPEKRKGRK